MWLDTYMNHTTCGHQHCNQPVDPTYARFIWSEAAGANVPMHTECSYAHPDYDVSLGCGSPFTTITLAAI